eukprot:CAMPEP_0185035640 /NCGR_PEP_ID=MMETSP1103-20130426/27388_1 /TAXON_ID=36769 /ORGANISM="Paraphysomonas bandaiensis, Strain Caron Lab Isolate" /LENGTH=238 /DNA_ID=CAMNT_0027572823 /DNA_START=198 /DNA_END=914 /DNA_ORIENTATION=+
MTRTYKGALQGFVPTYTIDDPEHDTHGYVGYYPTQGAIFVSFRGTESPANALDDLDVLLVDYPYCMNCSVHEGWYNAEQRIIGPLVDYLKQLRDTYPDYEVILTGHSLGAALATLAYIDMLPVFSPLQLYTFGSPRVGNTKFSIWASTQLVNHYRVTHHQDIVPHYPLHTRYQHVAGEYYTTEDSDGVVHVQICDGYEDVTCAQQWDHLREVSIADHMVYLNVTIGEDPNGSCAQIIA